MMNWQQCLIDERAALADKLGKLNIFLAGLDDDLRGLKPRDIALLQEQSAAMTHYLETLDRRIGRF